MPQARRVKTHFLYCTHPTGTPGVLRRLPLSGIKHLETLGGARGVLRVYPDRELILESDSGRAGLRALEDLPEGLYDCLWVRLHPSAYFPENTDQMKVSCASFTGSGDPRPRDRTALCAASAGHGRLDRQAISGTESTLGSLPNNRRRGCTHRPRFPAAGSFVGPDSAARRSRDRHVRSRSSLLYLLAKGWPVGRRRPPLWDEPEVLAEQTARRT